VTVTAPPRPHRPSDPVTHGEFDALVEALIEEARQRGQRRRRRNAAVVTLVTLVGVAVFALLGRSAQSQTASPALSVRSSLPAAAASSKIAFIREPPRAGYAGVLWVMNPDGAGSAADQRRRPWVRWSGIMPGARRRIAMSARYPMDIPADHHPSRDRVINADGSGQRRLTRNGVVRLRSCLVADGRKIAFVGRGDAAWRST
jgi:hypothetical protein